MKHRFNAKGASALIAGLAFALSAGMAAAASPDIAIPGDHVFPESITSAKDGTVYIGSIGEGAIFRVAPGAATAEPFVKPGPNQMSIFGVLADDKSRTLYACTNDAGMFGIATPGGKGPPALKAYDLKTGALKGSYTFPGDKGFCNDIAIGKDGAAYVTDSVIPRVLRLKPGAKQLEVWVENTIFGTQGINLDGIAFGADGNLYVTRFGGNTLLRVDVTKDMKAGTVTELALLSPAITPDGMRPLQGAKGVQFLLIEGGGLDVVTVDGDQASMHQLKGGMTVPVGVTQIGNTAYALEGQLNFIFDPSMKGKTPAPFKAYAVPLK